MRGIKTVRVIHKAVTGRMFRETDIVRGTDTYILLECNVEINWTRRKRHFSK